MYFQKRDLSLSPQIPPPFSFSDSSMCVLEGEDVETSGVVSMRHRGLHRGLYREEERASFGQDLR